MTNEERSDALRELFKKEDFEELFYEIEKIPQEKRAAVLMHSGAEKGSFMYEVLCDENSKLSRYLNLLPLKDRTPVLMRKNSKGYTILISWGDFSIDSKTGKIIDVLIEILPLIPREERILILTQQAANGKSILSALPFSWHGAPSLALLVPREDRSAVFLQPDATGKTVFDYLNEEFRCKCSTEDIEKIKVLLSTATIRFEDMPETKEESNSRQLTDTSKATQTKIEKIDRAIESFRREQQLRQEALKEEVKLAIGSTDVPGLQEKADSLSTKGLQRNIENLKKPAGGR